MCISKANRFTVGVGDFLKFNQKWYFAKNIRMRWNPTDTSYGSNWQELECFAVDQNFNIQPKGEATYILINYPELGIGDTFSVLRPCKSLDSIYRNDFNESKII